MKKNDMLVAVFLSIVAAGSAMAVTMVEKSSVGTAIENKEVTGAAEEFSTVERLYCWSKITSDTLPAKVSHIWYLDGKKEATVSLEVKSSPARTWSNKAVRPGQWKVEIVDDAEKVLATNEFTVKP